ncbi:MAG: aspartate carbamoyltransferase catalytic subunit [Archaeoglobi archaeon]|nr:aspartate carbamoyltransferase [Candidatus Mnemosynella bozhongmuii]MDK2782303.1 aspartate carbamoyltransferase catalytic subunit [Archaeoglobi archaeon]
MNFKNRDILSTRELTREEIDHILKTASKFDENPQEFSDILRGKILALVFYEPSTRTRMSFETAMKRLGGDVINLGAIEASSIAKGENLCDTIRIISNYADAIVLRHPKDGASKLAAEVSPVPVINGGDGAGHHPTQTLLDLYTMRKEGKLGRVKVALVGDLKYGRTVHSLIYALTLYDAEIILVSPKELAMPHDIVEDIRKAGGKIRETEDLKEVIPEVDVLYMTRIQKERFPDPNEYKRVAGIYRLTPELLKDAKEDMIVMHPLPRVDEIDPRVDELPNAKYFEQARNGIPVRMAVLSLVMGVME